jgi:hypothetical protein
VPIETVPAADPCAFKILAVDSSACGRGIRDRAIMTGDAIAAMLTAIMITCRLVFIGGLTLPLTEPFSHLGNINGSLNDRTVQSQRFERLRGEEICEKRNVAGSEKIEKIQSSMDETGQ